VPKGEFFIDESTLFVITTQKHALMRFSIEKYKLWYCYHTLLVREWFSFDPEENDENQLEYKKFDDSNRNLLYIELSELINKPVRKISKHFVNTFGGASLDSGIDSTYKYAVITGVVDRDSRDKIQELVNDPDNRYGKNIKVLLVSEVGSAGLDLKNVRVTVQLEAYWEYTRSLQFAARASRVGSHDLLKYEERDVKSYIYVASENTKLRSIQVNPEPETVDNRLYKNAIIGAKINNSALEALTRVSVESELYNYKDHYTCEASNAKLFTRDAISDTFAPNPCKPKVVKQVEVEEVIYNGEKLMYNKETKQYYKFNTKYNKYVLYKGEIELPTKIE
jgi:hypothetical protein